MFTTDKTNHQNNHADALVAILRSENERLKKGLVNIQSNLADSVGLNTANIRNCKQIE